MRLKSTGCIIIVLSLASFLEATAGDWQELYQKLHQTKGKRLEPSETLDILTRLDKIVQKSNDAKDVERKNAESLLDASRYSEPRCARSYLHSLNSFIQRNSAYQLSIAPYLQYHRRELFRFCQPNYGAKAQLDLAKLDKATLVATDQLRARVIAANGGKVERLYDNYPRVALISGIASYLNMQISQDPTARDAMTNGTISRQYYTQLANKYLRPQCSSYISAFQPKISPNDYKLFGDDELIKLIAPSQFERLVELKICLEIKPKLESFVDEAYRLLQKQTTN